MSKITINNVTLFQEFKSRAGRMASVLCTALIAAGLVAAGLVSALNKLVPAAYAQTSVTGGLVGAVTDIQGAAVPKASITVTNVNTGDTRVLTTNENGLYSAPYLTPGDYTVSAASKGLQSNAVSTRIMLGQQTVANLIETPTGNKETVTVNAGNEQLIDTESPTLVTTFNTKQFEYLPTPGGDITAIAFTVPGVVMGAGPGYGGFSSFGLPSVSNLVVINGMDMNDPYLNQNITGASVLTIGQFEIANASIVQNGYQTQYGRQAGTIENYSTKSGTNSIHGLVFWSYNSDGMNANSFLDDYSKAPKPLAVSNQYAAQIGGPLLKNKLFWFVDTEGIRFILPAGGIVNFPTADMQNNVLASIPTQSVPIYTATFDTLKTAPSYSTAIPITNGSGALQDGENLLGCGSYAGTPVMGKSNTYFGALPSGITTGTLESCMNTAITNANNLNREWFLATRVDYNLSGKNKLFGRFTEDQGRQPTFTSLINPVLNQQSIQPIYSGQLNDTEVFTPNLTNQFIMSGLYISETFGPANISQTLAASPAEIFQYTDGGDNGSVGLGQGGTLGFSWSYNPQGRRDTQYQFVDDLSWLRGKHYFNFGVNFKRDDVTSIGDEENTYGGYYYFGALNDFAYGSLPGQYGSNYNLNFTPHPAVYDELYNLGLYAQDEWHATHKLVIVYGIRVDRNENPRCGDNCFTRWLGGNFPQFNPETGPATINTPYNVSIGTGYANAFPTYQTAVYQPRAGFAWDTRNNGKTVVRGGLGLFADVVPAAIVANEYDTFPNVFSPYIYSGVVGTAAGSAEAYAQAGNAALNSGFSTGQSFSQIQAALAAQSIPFYPPQYYIAPNNFKSPEYAEWNLEIQQQLRSTDALIINYVGNHGFRLMMPNYTLNETTAGSLYGNNNIAFQNLPSTYPDPRFATVGTFSQGAVSNYNGLIVEYKHMDRRGLLAHFAYTHSHALDDISNGGSGLVFTNSGLTDQIVPGNTSQLMYSNADYDIRNNFVADVTYAEPYRFHNKIADNVAGGWTVGGKAYWRSGGPFSVTNGDAGYGLDNSSGTNTVLAQVLNNDFDHTCLSYWHPCFQKAGIFNGASIGGSGQLVGIGPYPQVIWGNAARNSFYGPHFSDIDISLHKDIVRVRSILFELGAQAYNVLNHPNFGSPYNNASDTSLGYISPGNTLATPTTPYGKYEGAGSRVLVVQGRLNF